MSFVAIIYSIVIVFSLKKSFKPGTFSIFISCGLSASHAKTYLLWPRRHAYPWSPSFAVGNNACFLQPQEHFLLYFNKRIFLRRARRRATRDVQKKYFSTFQSHRCALPPLPTSALFSSPIEDFTSKDSQAWRMSISIGGSAGTFSNFGGGGMNLGFGGKLFRGDEEEEDSSRRGSSTAFSCFSDDATSCDSWRVTS